MTGLGWRIFLVLLALVVVRPVAPAFAEPPAAGEPVVVAQYDGRPLLYRLFGKRNPDPLPPPPGAPRVIRVQPSTQPAAPAATTQPRRTRPAAPEVIVTPKDPDARRVLVIGDEMAASLTRGLEVAFADTPKVNILGAAVEGSGLAVTEPVNWIEKTREALAGENPADAVVVMFGLSDMKPLDVDGEPAEFRSPDWEKVYRARFRSVLLAARSRNVPVFVVGLVPMADIGLTTDVAFLDDLYRQEAESAFTTYINVWNEFADETGGYAASGPDVGGQSRQLRLNDGIGFTRSGSRKLAFYVEQEIRAWVEKGAPGMVLPVMSGDGLVMSLTDPEAGPDEELAGLVDMPAPRDGSPLHELVVLGRPLPPVVGRVDDLAVR
jgi:uncharacterized protein